MPTYGMTAAFRREWNKLSDEQRVAFRAAVGLFVSDLREGKGFRPGLRVHKLKGEDVWSVSFGPDSRATFTYGAEVLPGQHHVVWHHIGTHGIYGK